MVKRNGREKTEADLVRRIRRWAGPAPASQLALGIGDDCAIYRPRGSREDLLFTTDLLMEDVHFRRSTHGAADVGWKCLARGLSDIAAMGGEPRFCLVSLAVGTWADDQWVDGFYGGLLRLARREGTALAGGDLARAEKAACDIVVCGAVPRGRALRRDGARAGDAIYVSGALGGSAVGLARAEHAAPARGGDRRNPGALGGSAVGLAQAERAAPARGGDRRNPGALGGSAVGLARAERAAPARGGDRRNPGALGGAAWRRHVRPEPRLALGRFVRETLRATAAMDLSDGLSLDLQRLCAASKLMAEIAAPPVFRGASLAQALHGGEDYELLFTVPARIPVPREFEGLPLTRIGTMRRGKAGVVQLDGAPLAALGWDHFRGS
jgi:thiamine-monophosphate kinase